MPLDLVDTVNAFVGPMRVLAANSSGTGPLAGTALGVKDVIDVAGVVTRAGNPTFAAGRAPAAANAPAVEALVDGGATVVGKTITDELAYSLAGTNAHDGTPVNVAAPGRIPGGSSAGSAAAVAAGLCDLALGTDTGGSIRVPASYCGILGWRPTHGLVDDGGIVHLARSFDTVGLLARDPRVLLVGAELLVADRAVVATPVASSVMVSELLGVVDGDARASLIEASGPDVVALGVDLDECARAFRFLQGREAWTEHGAWITAARPDMGTGIAARFAAASQVTDEEVTWAQRVRDTARRLVVDATAGGRVLLGPAAAGAAPPLDEDPDSHGATRARTLALTCLAGLAGAPVVVLPLARDHDLPFGMACLGAPGSDLALLHWAAEGGAA